LASFVNPGILGSPRAFNNVYADPIQTSLLPTASNSEVSLGKCRSEELSKITSKFILRRYVLFNVRISKSLKEFKNYKTARVMTRFTSLKLLNDHDISKMFVQIKLKFTKQ